MNPLIDFLNHVLAQNSRAGLHLKGYAGKTVRVVAPPFVDIMLTITPEGAVALPAAGATPPGSTDIVFRIDPSQLPLMLADRERAMKDVRIEGDAEFAQVIGMLAREVRWDAEEDLSRVIGDVPAYRAMQGLRAFMQWGRDAAQRLAGSGAAFLIDEEAVLVRREVAERHSSDVAAARDACARLEKRIALLEAARGAQSASPP